MIRFYRTHRAVVFVGTMQEFIAWGRALKIAEKLKEGKESCLPKN